MVRAPAFRRVFAFLNRVDIPYVLIGGLASGLQGEPRLTFDVDVLVFLPDDALTRLLRAARKAGSRFPSARARESVRRKRFLRLTLWGTDIDFLVADSVYEFEILSRRHTLAWKGVPVFVAAPEDLILLKLWAGRPIDWKDAKAVQVRQGPRLDVEYLTLRARRLRVQHGKGHVLSRLRKLFRMKYRLE